MFGYILTDEAVSSKQRGIFGLRNRGQTSHTNINVDSAYRSYVLIILVR